MENNDLPVTHAVLKCDDFKTKKNVIKFKYNSTN